jgi:hypothetical protein
MASFSNTRRRLGLLHARPSYWPAYWLPAGLLLAVLLAVSSVTDTARAAEQAVKDTFNTSAPGTPLPAHSPEVDAVGGGWQQSIGADFRITADGLAAFETGVAGGPAIAVIDTLVSEYDLTVTGTRDVQSSVMGVVVRYVDEHNYFVARHNGSVGELVKVVNGAEHVLDSATLQT